MVLLLGGMAMAMASPQCGAVPLSEGGDGVTLCLMKTIRDRGGSP